MIIQKEVKVKCPHCKGINLIKTMFIKKTREGIIPRIKTCEYCKSLLYVDFTISAHISESTLYTKG